MYPSIEAATDKLEVKAVESPEDWDSLTIDRAMQNEFLIHFASSFNITLSLARAGAKPHQLMRWRNTELCFVREYNDIHNEWKSKLITSAMTRAVGYLSPCDPRNPTTSGYREDAAGTPIYEGADSRLTLRMLEAHFPETYSPTLAITNPAALLTIKIPDDASGADAADAYAQLVASQ